MFEIKKIDGTDDVQVDIASEKSTMRLRIPTLPSHEESYRRSQKTPEACPFGTLASTALGLHPQVDQALAELCAGDTVLERDSLRDVYQSFGEGVLRDVATGVTAAAREAKNTDLRAEIRDQRALDKLTPALEKLPAVLDKAVAPLEERVQTLTAALEGALLPAPVEGHAVVVRELRADQIRRRYLDLPELDRPAFVLRLAEKGRIDELHALDDDVTGERLVPDDIAGRAREIALRARGGAELLTSWRDSLKILERAGAVVDVTAGQIINGLPIAANKKPKLTGVSGRIKSTMADSAKRLRLAGWPA